MRNDAPCRDFLMEHTYPPPARRMLITGATMMASIMATLDATVANVALPHIQSTLSASPEQVIWVVTSYVVGQAIATPLAGWLATRIGRNRVMAGSILLFTLSSVACGLAATLPALVAFRFIQGLFGAATVPLSQATLLDTYPPEEYGKAMAYYGIGSMFGGVAGPVVGGVLTEYMSWRWIFLVNLPVGLATSAALYAALPKNRPQKSRFDLFGFTFLSIALASLQLMIDRGAQIDWFDSVEVQIEAVVAALSFYIFVVHLFTARNPYIQPALFTNRNFVVGSAVATALGVLVFSALPIFGTMLQTMLGYPVMMAGMMMAPRSIGTALSMFIAGSLMARFDARLIMAFALLMSGYAFYEMSHMSLETDQSKLIVVGLFMGVGAGLLFVPLSTMAFTTLPASLRNEGTSLMVLFRFIGTSAGITLLQDRMMTNSATVQSRLVEGIRPDNPIVLWGMPSLDFGAIAQLGPVYGQAVRQAMMVAYVDTYWLMFLLCVIMVPLAFAMKPPRKGEAIDTHAMSSE